MSAPTEREVVLRERQAFADGAVCWVSECHERTHSYPPRKTVTLDEITADAARKFPLPTVTRPRIWTDSDGCQYRVTDGVVQWRMEESDASWLTASGEFTARYKAVADLIANPTETVPEDA